MASWSNVPSGTMGAAVLTNPGQDKPSDCFTYDPAYPKPSLPSEDWLLVRVRAAGVNRAEIRARNHGPVSKMEFGMFMDEFHDQHPKILGEEFVGEVEEAGKNSGYKAGDVVCGFAYGGGKPYDGAYAQYTIIHKQRTYRLPDSARELGWDVLGAIPMGMWTAYGAIFNGGRTKPGDSVLIHGGTSSVGIWGILVAKDQGCTVVATTRQASKVQKLKDAGADFVVLEDDLEADPQAVTKLIPGGVNCVIELIGLHKLKAVAIPACAKYGTIVILGILANVWSLPTFEVGFIPALKYVTSYTTQDDEYDWITKTLVETVEKVRTGVYKKEVFLDSAFELKDVGKSHDRMESDETCGKIVLLC